MKQPIHSWLVALLAIALTPTVDAAPGSLASAKIPAFPGAEGFGAHSTGGRGGDVYQVTHFTVTDDDGHSWTQSCALLVH